MNEETAIENLKKAIKGAYDATSGKLRPNIARGHLRSISTDIEDAIAIFVSDLIPGDYKILLDPSIHVDGVNNRPDMIVVDSRGSVKAMVEIKANMGFCRDATGVIDGMVENDKKFKKNQKLVCEFSRDENFNASYGENVVLFLVSLTEGNCPEAKHQKNKEYASQNGVNHYLLFSGWYGNLADKEITDFALKLAQL